MKKTILLLLFIMLGGSSIHAQSQYKIQFSYDTAGNQSLRDRVCVNCGSTAKAVDSTLVADVDEKSDLIEEKEDTLEDLGIVAYPNPVTDILAVEWIATKNPVQQIVVFSRVNQQLASKKIKSNQGNIGLDFSTYPAGMYIVVVFYMDKTKQSFQVIKK